MRDGGSGPATRDANSGAGLRRGIPLAKPQSMVLALGIGANSAIFSLVSAVWLKPLRFTDAERLLG